MFRGMDMNGQKSGKNMNGKKKFPIGWLLPVVALSFFLSHFWSYIPVVRAIVSLFVLSKIVTGTTPGAFLL